MKVLVLQKLENNEDICMDLAVFVRSLFASVFNVAKCVSS